MPSSDFEIPRKILPVIIMCQKCDYNEYSKAVKMFVNELIVQYSKKSENCADFCIAAFLVIYDMQGKVIYTSEVLKNCGEIDFIDIYENNIKSNEAISVFDLLNEKMSTNGVFTSKIGYLIPIIYQFKYNDSMCNLTSTITNSWYKVSCKIVFDLGSAYIEDTDYHSNWAYYKTYGVELEQQDILDVICLLPGITNNYQYVGQHMTAVANSIMAYWSNVSGEYCDQYEPIEYEIFSVDIQNIFDKALKRQLSKQKKENTEANEKEDKPQLTDNGEKIVSVTDSSGSDCEYDGWGDNYGDTSCENTDDSDDKFRENLNGENDFGQFLGGAIVEEYDPNCDDYFINVDPVVDPWDDDSCDDGTWV